jgi:hypothetical protein
MPDTFTAFTSAQMKPLAPRFTVCCNSASYRNLEYQNLVECQRSVNHSHRRRQMPSSLVNVSKSNRLAISLKQWQIHLTRGVFKCPIKSLRYEKQHTEQRNVNKTRQVVNNLRDRFFSQATRLCTVISVASFGSVSRLLNMRWPLGHLSRAYNLLLVRRRGHFRGYASLLCMRRPPLNHLPATSFRVLRCRGGGRHHGHTAAICARRSHADADTRQS